MGDYFIHLVAPELDHAGAEGAKRAVEGHLIDNSFVLSEESHCVLSGNGTGHPPGPQFQELFSDAVQSLGLITNGVHIAATEKVRFFHPGQNTFSLICPSCRSRLSTSSWKPWQDAMTSYFSGGPGLLSCQHCDRANKVDQWIYVPHAGFSRFSVTFWNSPPLRKERVRELSDIVGCPLQIVQGKL